MSSVTLKGDDLRQDGTSIVTPEFTIVHGDHGLEPAHVDFIKAVMSKRETGSFICESFELPKDCPDLYDGLYGPINGDEPVSESEVYYAVRGDRTHPSRMVDRPLRPCRNIVIIGLCNEVLWTAYGSLAGVVAPRETFDPFFNDPANAEAKDEAEAIWKVNALSRQREVVNLTPHPLNLRDRHGNVINFAKPEPYIELPRVAQVTNEVGFVGDFVDYQSTYGEVINLPIDDGRIYVVSRLVISACAAQGLSHAHLRSPGALIRDSDGKIVGAEGLAR